jgi:hypothetical protein
MKQTFYAQHNTSSANLAVSDVIKQTTENALKLFLCSYISQDVKQRNLWNVF